MYKKSYTGRANINIYWGDCMDFMRSKPDNYYSLSIVDPPYGITQPAFRKESKNKAAKTTDYNNAVYNQIAPTDEYFNSLKRASKNYIVWGGNYYNQYLENGKKWIFWDKGTEKTQWGDGELAFTSFNGAITKFQFTWNGMIQGNMKNKESRIHPTQKPVQLYKWLLTNYAKEGDTIFDSHGGSMSIAIACWEMGFDLDICELDKDYFDAAVKRFENHIAQQTLF